jgi:hypothetical protein
MPPRKRAHVQATFGPRGQALWDALAPGMPVARRVLLDEACRLADRLDKLDAIASGSARAFASIRVRGEDMPAELVVNGALSEARMTATALRQILTELAPAVAGDEAAPAAGGSVSNDLAKRRAERLAKAAASVCPA